MNVVLLLATSLLLLAANLHAQAVILDGFTYRSTDAGYEPLGGIKIVATRDDGIVGFAESDNSGQFELKVKGGGPFLVAFYGEQRVPELQQLSGKPGAHNTVHITLLTPRQYERMFGTALPLNEKLDCDDKRVPAAVTDFHAHIKSLRR